MTAAVIPTLVTVFGSISAIGLTYWFTKKREREAEWRKAKLEHYKDFVASLSGVIAGETSAEGQRLFARACNNLMLVAPQPVIEALRLFQQEIKISNPDTDLKRHDDLMARLFLEMRRDLQISPEDDPKTFQIGLWAAGVKPSRR